MSHKRSFAYMRHDELEIKLELDSQKLSALENGPLYTIKEHGWSGVDEALYAVGQTVLGRRNKSKQYLTNQIDRTKHRLRELLPQDGIYGRVRQREGRPRHRTLKTLREDFRHERIRGMRDAGEDLYPSEKVKHAGKSIDTYLTSALEGLGAVGRAIGNNKLWATTVLLASLASFSGYNWFNSSGIYQDIAVRYEQSHEVGPRARPLKRDIPDEMIIADIKLVHTDKIEITVSDDDGGSTTFTIPEKLSNPQGARINIRNIQGILQDNLSNIVIDSFQSLNENDKRRLRGFRDSAGMTFEQTDASLAMATNQQVSYPNQIGMLSSGNGMVQQAVDTLESYMDPSIVEKEDSAHFKMSIWKWLALGSAGLAGLFGFNALKNGHSGRIRRRYRY